MVSVFAVFVMHNECVGLWVVYVKVLTLAWATAYTPGLRYWDTLHHCRKGRLLLLSFCAPGFTALPHMPCIQTKFCYSITWCKERSMNGPTARWCKHMMCCAARTTITDFSHHQTLQQDSFFLSFFALLAGRGMLAYWVLGRGILFGISYLHQIRDSHSS